MIRLSKLLKGQKKLKPDTLVLSVWSFKCTTCKENGKGKAFEQKYEIVHEDWV